MDDLYKLPGRRRFSSPMPAPERPADHPPSWAIGLSALAAVASVAFTILLYLNR
jgi:hypothetical protein